MMYHRLHDRQANSECHMSYQRNDLSAQRVGGDLAPPVWTPVRDGMGYKSSCFGRMFLWRAHLQVFKVPFI